MKEFLFGIRLWWVSILMGWVAASIPADKRCRDLLLSVRYLAIEGAKIK